MFWEIPTRRNSFVMSRVPGTKPQFVGAISILYLISVVLSVSEPYTESSVFSSKPTASPVFNGGINYRTKVLGMRYGEAILQPTTPSLIPRLTVKSYEEPKTEYAPMYDDSDEGNTELPVGRQVSRSMPLDPTTPTPPDSTTKGKSKSRRRKVKRPHKSKGSTTPRSSDDLGLSTDKKPDDKNLALEIGSEDGKYALISTFFGNSSKSVPPGIISYATSNDFVEDNAQSLGKLDENDIWLSEGHLLVVKGGDFDSTSRDKWAPIDDYERDKSKPPLRIRLDTQNPPPFPVFVNQSGPPIFIGPPPPFPIPPGYGDFNETFDPSRLPPPGLIPLLPNGTLPGFFPPPPGFNHSFPHGPLHGPPQGLVGPPGGGGLYGNGGLPPNGGVYGYGQPPSGNNSFPPPPFYPFPPPLPGGIKNGSFPPPFPFGPPPPGFHPNFPPGGPPPFFPPLVLNPKDNETDDPSIFLPPPYDFDYHHEDNSPIVPPGPFAPGLVVPPPKDFYRVYEKPPNVSSTTPLSIFISEKPQRANAKKPKFPITNPPDDSLEETLPVTPSLIPKKRKERPKSGKSYTLKTSSEESGESPSPPKLLVTQIPVVFTARQVSPTPKPLNYLYVHGKLKSLAEIVAEDVAQEPTPAPAYDPLGYPNRAAPPQIVSSDYELSKKKKPTRKQRLPKVHFVGQQGHRQVYPSVNPYLYTPSPEPYYYTNSPSPPSYFSPVTGTNQNTQQVYQLVPQSQYYQAPPPVSYNPPEDTTSYSPQPQQKKRTRSRIIFPDDQDRRPVRLPKQQQQQQQQPQQPSPLVYHNPFLFQSQYYPQSPVSQFQSTNQFLPNAFLQNGNSPGTFTTQYFHQPNYYPQQSQSQQYQEQSPQNTYYNIEQVPQQEVEQGQVVPLHSDIHVNYREPLPQYNAESETVTTRSVLKAGPISSGIYGIQPTGELSLAQGSFYSFERGGPGGFSYKIQL